MNLSLFDLPAPTPSRPDLDSDVILRAEHKAGPFRHLPGDRFYQIVVTMDGRVWAEFTGDHSRRAAPGLTRAFIDENLKSRVWREVEG